MPLSASVGWGRSDMLCALDLEAITGLPLEPVLDDVGQPAAGNADDEHDGDEDDHHRDAGAQESFRKRIGIP